MFSLLHPRFSWKRFIFSKVFLELQMENEWKAMANYLFNLKLTMSKTELKMLFHFALISTIYCMTDVICTVACQEIKVVRFLGSFYLCLFLDHVNQTTKSNYQKIIRFRVRDFQNKRQVSYHHSNYFLH